MPKKIGGGVSGEKMKMKIMHLHRCVLIVSSTFTQEIPSWSAPKNIGKDKPVTNTG